MSGNIVKAVMALALLIGVLVPVLGAFAEEQAVGNALELTPSEIGRAHV